jgi:hypothetical protein
MRYPKKKTRLLVTVILVVCFSLVAALAMAQGSTPEKPKKAGERGQMCPPAQASGKGLCTVGGDCPTAKSPCQAVCQPSSDCPAAKPAESGKKGKEPENK